MIISGIADEASPELEGQIRAHRKLGWNTLELRLIGKTNICQIDDGGFEQARRALEQAGMGVVCFASPIANWSRPITADFSVDVQDLRRSIPRLQQLGTRFIRVMSYPNDGLEESAWRSEAVRRMKELARIAEDGGVVLLHENCSGWGGVRPENQRVLLEEVASARRRPGSSSTPPGPTSGTSTSRTAGAWPTGPWNTPCPGREQAWSGRSSLTRWPAATTGSSPSSPTSAPRSTWALPPAARRRSRSMWSTAAGPRRSLPGWQGAEPADSVAGFSGLLPHSQHPDNLQLRRDARCG
jgi:hypothetical protein